MQLRKSAMQSKMWPENAGFQSSKSVVLCFLVARSSKRGSRGPCKADLQWEVDIEQAAVASDSDVVQPADRVRQSLPEADAEHLLPPVRDRQLGEPGAARPGVHAYIEDDPQSAADESSRRRRARQPGHSASPIHSRSKPHRKQTRSNRSQGIFISSSRSRLPVPVFTLFYYTSNVRCSIHAFRLA